MNQIEKQHFKEIGSLEAASFFHFLVREGCRLSLITVEQLETLQHQLILLLADRFNRWTGGQSSSVPEETGRQIQQSTFYTVGYYLKSLPDAENALEALKAEALPDLFQKGLKLITERRKEAAEQLRYIQENRLTTDVLAYNDTLEKGLPMFFASYEPDYEANETPASIDYPLGNDKMNLTGVEYIIEYLRKLRLENEFCSYFPGEEIHGLMFGYDRHYKELLFNIYDLVLTNAIGGQLLGRDGTVLHISDFDRQYLQRELSRFPAEQLDGQVDAAVAGLCGKLSITDMQMVNYIRASSVNLKSRLKNALGSGGLQHLFLSAENNDEEPVLRFEDKEMLDHDSFRRLAEAIRECRLVSDKIALLQSDPLGMTDLVDLLEGNCFFGEEEYPAVFGSLDDIRLALLAKKLPLDPADDGFLEEESGQKWQSSLILFLSQMEPGRKAAILSLGNLIKY